MFCESCGQKEATVLFTQILGQEKQVHHFCRKCAAERSETSVGVTLSVTAGPMREAAEERANLVCSGCGLTFYRFQKVGLFGCPDCYRAFEPELDEIFRRIHGASRYNAAEKSDGESPVRLAKQLKMAVDREAYEEAAKLRDRLLTLTKKGKSGES